MRKHDDSIRKIASDIQDETSKLTESKNSGEDER